MPRIKLIDESAVRDNRLTIISVKRDDYAVYRKNGRIYIYLDNCPHTDAPMGADCLEGDEIVCPMHDAKFHACTGKVLSPPATTGLRMYEPVIIDGAVWIDAD